MWGGLAAAPRREWLEPEGVGVESGASPASDEVVADVVFVAVSASADVVVNDGGGDDFVDLVFGQVFVCGQVEEVHHCCYLLSFVVCSLFMVLL